jgi:hypothetical protein
MSASRFTDRSIECDRPACEKQVWASQTAIRDSTATLLRKELKRRGWLVAVRDEAGGRHRFDFCPDHKPQEG